MHTLNINLDGINRKLKYVEKLYEGIYVSIDKSQVKKNCKELYLKLDTSTPDMQMQDSRIGNLPIITKHFLGNYLQYLILDTASPEAVDVLLSRVYADNEQLSALAGLSMKDINERFQASARRQFPR